MFKSPINIRHCFEISSKTDEDSENAALVEESRFEVTACLSLITIPDRTVLGNKFEKI